MYTNAKIERVKGIIASEVDGELIVCSAETNETSLLSGEVAEVFLSIPDSGHTTLEALGEHLPDADLEAAITILLDRGLIVNEDKESLLSRRDVLIKSGRLAAATALVASIGMPRPAAAQSCGCGPRAPRAEAPAWSPRRSRG